MPESLLRGSLLLSSPVFVDRAHAAVEQLSDNAFWKRKGEDKSRIEEVLPITALLKHLHIPERDVIGISELWDSTQLRNFGSIFNSGQGRPLGGVGELAPPGDQAGGVDTIGGWRLDTEAMSDITA